MINYCLNCKNLIKVGDKYCIECGIKLKWDSPLKSIVLSEEVITENEPPVTIDRIIQKMVRSEGYFESNFNQTVVLPVNEEENEAIKSNININLDASIVDKIEDGLKTDIGRNENVSNNDEEEKEVSVKIRLSDIVLRSGILSILIIFLSFFWWFYIREGDPNLLEDMDILIIFCCPGLLFGIFTTVLGSRDIARMKLAENEHEGLGRSITGIILSTFSIGMIATLILIRWVLL